MSDEERAGVGAGLAPSSPSPLPASAPALVVGGRFVPARMRTFAALLVAVMALGLGVRLVALATATSCRIGSTQDVVSLADEPTDGCVIVNDTTSYVASARADAEGRWFQQPRDWLPGASGEGLVYEPTALHPPLFALVLSVPYRLGVTGVDGLRVFAAFLGLATIGLTGLVGRRLGGPRVGLIAALLVAVHPMVWINDVVLMSEALYAPLALCCMLAAYRWWDEPSPRRAAALGVALGLAALARSEAILGVVLIGVPLCLGRRGTPRRDARLALAAVTGAAVLTVLPWLALNQVRYHRPVAFTTSLGVAAQLANCDATYYSSDRFGSRSPACLLALTDPARAAEVDLPPVPDESDFDSVLRDGAADYVHANLGRAPVVAMARVGRMWGVYRPFDSIRLDEPVEQRGVGRSQLGVILGWAVAAAAVVGAVDLFRRRVPLSPLLAWVASATIVAVGDLGLHRFRAAAEIALCLLAAVAVDSWLTTRAALSSVPDQPQPS